MKRFFLPTLTLLFLSGGPGATPATARTIEKKAVRTTTLAAGEAGKVNLAWNVTLPEGARLDKFYVYSVEDPTFRGSNFIEAPKECSLPAGHYFFTFVASNPDNFHRYIYVSEDLDCSQDATFNFDMTECTNNVKVETMLPNGILACPEIRSDTGGITFEGNIENGTLNVSIFRDGAKLVVDHTDSSIQKIDLGYMTLTRGSQFFINQPGEKYEIGMMRHMIMKESKDQLLAFDAIRATDLKPETKIQNEAGGYIKFNANYGDIQDTPNKINDEEFYRSTFLLIFEDKVADAGGFGITSGEMSSTTWVSCNKSAENHSGLLFSYGKALSEDYENGSIRIFHPVNSLPITFNNGKATFNCYLATHLLENSELMRPKDGMEFFLDKPLYAHPRFSFEYNPEAVPTFGNSVPVLVAATMWQSSYPNYSGLLPMYFGRLGEYMEPDLYSGWSKVDVDGEKIFEGNIQELIAWSNSEFSLIKHSGRYTFTIEDDCPMVDGKEGFNRTVIKTDASGSDREAPTLTMLNFRNSLDEITDRFNEPADGTLEFSAADLNSAVNNFGIKWFAVDSPASVKVEYAPEDSEDFRKLEATEIPEFYFEPCFGSFYRAPLEAISSYSPSGWYKLRLTVADAAGNTQEQTISPAFHIDNLSSVYEVSNDSSINREGNVFRADGMISLYDTTGRLLKSGKGTLSADGLHGVFIVKAAGKSLKVTL